MRAGRSYRIGRSTRFAATSTKHDNGSSSARGRNPTCPTSPVRRSPRLPSWRSGSPWVNFGPPSQDERRRRCPALSPHRDHLAPTPTPTPIDGQRAPRARDRTGFDSAIPMAITVPAGWSAATSNAIIQGRVPADRKWSCSVWRHGQHVRRSVLGPHARQPGPGPERQRHRRGPRQSSPGIEAGPPRRRDHRRLQRQARSS